MQIADEQMAGRNAAKVRSLHPEDADAVVAISAKSPEAALWSVESYRIFFEQQSSFALAIEEESEIAGFLVARQIEYQAEVLNLAVRTSHRRRGFGTKLLGAALEKLQSRGVKTVYLEVRESNTGAIAFYSKHGFEKTGKRLGYYRAPDEGAILMEMKFTV